MKPTLPVPDTTGTLPAPSLTDQARANEAWWQAHGGTEWLEEVERRRTSQPHYRQQERFLQAFLIGLPPVRVLDFGCGFGRHLRHLRSLPHLELYGVDMSARMVEACRTYIGDPAFTDERVQVVPARGRLPFPDRFFDVVYTSEVLIHVDPLDLPGILRELSRVAASVVLHIENMPVSPSRKDNSAHDGCWLHDFTALYRELGNVDLQLHPNVIDLQCVYLATRPGARLRAGDAEPRLSGKLSAELEEQTRRLHTVANEAAELELKNRELLDAVSALESSPIAKIARRLQTIPAVETVSSSLLKVRRAALNLGQRAEPEAEGAPELPFGGFATRASLPTPEAFRAARPEVVSLCHPEWRGIKGATYGQNRYVLEVPGIVDERQCEALWRFLAECGTRKLVINGFPPGSEELALAIGRHAPQIAVSIVYHGTPAQALHREDIPLQHMLNLVDQGVVRKLGFVKSGLAEYFRTIGYPAEYVMNMLTLPVRPPRTAVGSDGRLHVGVFSPNFVHKNVVTQVLAALMVPDAVVHTCEMPHIEYLQRSSHRIRNHGIMPFERFQDLLGTMHASLYVSLVECYPMTVLESIAGGVVCLTSHTSKLFDDDRELFDALVVTEHDNPTAIARKLMDALPRREELVLKAQAHLERLNAAAGKRWAEFLA